MKKAFIIAILSLSFSVPSFAATTGSTIDDFGTTGATLYGDASDATSTSTTKTSIGRTSTGVAVAWYCDSGGNGYAIMTQHESGTKAYGSSYDSTAIYQTLGSVTPGTAAYNSGALTATDTTDFVTSGWDAM